MVSGADWFSFLNGQDTMRLFLPMSLVWTFSTGWFLFGLLFFGVGIIGGLFLALFFGEHSAEYTNFFGYFVALSMLGALLVFLGRPRPSGR